MSFREMELCILMKQSSICPCQPCESICMHLSAPPSKAGFRRSLLHLRPPASPFLVLFCSFCHSFSLNLSSGLLLFFCFLFSHHTSLSSSSLLLLFVSLLLHLLSYVHTALSVPSTRVSTFPVPNATQVFMIVSRPLNVR